MIVMPLDETYNLIIGMDFFKAFDAYTLPLTSMLYFKADSKNFEVLLVKDKEKGLLVQTLSTMCIGLYCGKPMYITNIKVEDGVVVTPIMPPIIVELL